MPQQMLMPSHLEPSFLSFDRPPQDFPPLRSGDPLAFNLPPLLQLDDDVPRFSGDRTPPSLPRDPSFSLLEELEYGSYEGRQGCNGKLTRSGTVTPRMAFND